MKIVIIGTAHPLRGGLAAFNERITEELMKDGHQVTLYSFSLQYPNFLFPGKTQYTDEPAPSGLDIKSEINSINPLNWLKVGNQLRKEAPDLILVRYWLPFFGPCLGTILRKAKKNKHTKVIAIVDNAIPHEKRVGDQAFTQYFVGAIDGFITMSHQVMNDLKLFKHHSPVHYTPHPIYDIYGEQVERKEALAHLGLKAHHKYLLFFGFIRHYKGLDILLEAMKCPQMQEQDIHLIVAGEFYVKEGTYDELLSQHPNRDHIHMFTSFIPNDEVKYYFSAADMVVQPYRTATQSGISQIAYHFHKPMVVTHVGGLPEIVPHEKLGLVTPVDSTEIANAILRMYDENLLDKYAEGVANEKKKYQWSSFVSKIMEVYEQIL